MLKYSVFHVIVLQEQGLIVSPKASMWPQDRAEFSFRSEILWNWFYSESVRWFSKERISGSGKSSSIYRESNVQDFFFLYWVFTAITFPQYFISTRQAGKISNYCGRARSGYSIGAHRSKQLSNWSECWSCHSSCPSAWDEILCGVYLTICILVVLQLCTLYSFFYTSVKQFKFRMGKMDLTLLCTCTTTLYFVVPLEYLPIVLNIQ